MTMGLAGRLPRHFKLFKLRQKNNDRQAVDKTEHDRMRHQTDEFAQPEYTGQDLQHSH